MRQPIRLVTFDALYTIIVPRLPIHVQYSQTLEPYLGVLDPSSLKQSFREAFQSLGRERPVYGRGSRAWWSEVIKRTALGAGANEKALNASLPQIVPRLLDRFSSKEGYMACDDAITVGTGKKLKLAYCTMVPSQLTPCKSYISGQQLSAILILGFVGFVLAFQLQSLFSWFLGSVLRDLEFPTSLDPIILSEEEGVEKPSPELYRRALTVVNTWNQRDPIVAAQCLHVGDELDADFYGARAAGMNALLLRRDSADCEQAHRSPEELKGDVTVVKDLRAVLAWVTAHNNTI